LITYAPETEKKEKDFLYYFSYAGLSLIHAARYLTIILNSIAAAIQGYVQANFQNPKNDFTSPPTLPFSTHHPLRSALCLDDALIILIGGIKQGVMERISRSQSLLGFLTPVRRKKTIATRPCTPTSIVPITAGSLALSTLAHTFVSPSCEYTLFQHAILRTEEYKYISF
jgi:hypothetical protein